MTDKPYKCAIRSQDHWLKMVGHQPDRDPCIDDIDMEKVKASIYDQNFPEAFQKQFSPKDYALSDIDELTHDEFILEPIGVGKYGRSHKATLQKSRNTINGEVLLPGTQIALKTMPLYSSKREIEALSRSLWLRQSNITEFVPELYGVFTTQCYMLPIGRERKWSRSTFNNKPCATVEIEFVDQTFYDMRFNRILPLDMDIGADRTNPNAQQIPDSVVFETILGEFATIKYLGISIEDRKFDNYGVKQVDYWRIYTITFRNGEVGRYALSPGFSVRRFDCGIWTASTVSDEGVPMHLTTHANPLQTMAGLFLGVSLLTDVSYHALFDGIVKENSIKKALEYFELFKVSKTWQPHGSDKFKEFFIEL